MAGIYGEGVSGRTGRLRRTKIVATIGPASDTPAVVRGLVEAGVDVFRIGLAHGTVDEHLARLRMIRETAAAAGRPLGVVVDLPGPKIRCGECAPPGIELREGDTVRLVPGDEPTVKGLIYVDYDGLVTDVEAGDPVVLGDGAVTLRVVEAGATPVLAVVEHGGRIQGRPGVHLPAEKLRLATPTEEDLELLEVFAPAGVDYVAVSFVRDSGDVARVRDAVAGRGPRVMAKIETGAAV